VALACRAGKAWQGTLLPELLQALLLSGFEHLLEQLVAQLQRYAGSPAMSHSGYSFSCMHCSETSTTALHHGVPDIASSLCSTTADILLLPPWAPATTSCIAQSAAAVVIADASQSPE